MVRSKYNTDCSISYQALRYSWLARCPVTAEVVGSSPIQVASFYNWGLSSAGRAPALQAGGHRFEPCRPQLFSKDVKSLPMWLNWQSSWFVISRLSVRVRSSAFIFGWVPEWPKGADCKSVVSDFGGSNPPPSTKIVYKASIMTRGGAVWKLVGLITRRSEVQILPPLLCPDSSVGRAEDWKSSCRWFDSGSGHVLLQKTACSFWDIRILKNCRLFVSQAKIPPALLEEARFSEYPISEIMGCLKGKCSLMVQMMMSIKACDYLKNILEYLCCSILSILIFHQSNKIF